MSYTVSRTKRVSPGILRTRFQLGLLLCFVWMGVIILRLVYLQVIQHDYWILRANKQRQSIITLDPERGPILDRKGRQLAISIDVDSIYAMPDEMKDPLAELKAISSIVQIDVKDLMAHMNGKSFCWIIRKVPSEIADNIRRLQLPGIYFTEESRRFYPSKELAAHVVGFVGVDNKGLSGIEYQYERVIAGVPGKLPALRDAKKRILLSGHENALLAPTVGRTLQLTIDSAIQHIAEQELKAVIEEQNAKGGSVIVMNPYTGEIIALANEPTFNPNAYQDYSPAEWKDRAIQDYYEPGSTFKTVIAAAALDRGLVKPDDLFDCQHGSIVVAGHVIHDHKSFGILPFRDVIAKSSDVGMIKVGLMVGADPLVKYTKMFGFGKRTTIDLPGEGPGVVHDARNWSAITIGAFSMGQEIGVTALQVARMMAAVANGGYLPVPHCVSGITDSSGHLLPTVVPEPQPVPIKHEALAILQQLLQGVVDVGTAKEASIPGYTAAGKTGTAQKIGPSHTYKDGGYIASFVGYAPVNHPAFVMIAVIDEPKKLYHGGEVAAPLFRKIGQQVLKYLDIPPDRIPDNPATLKAESAFPREMQANAFPEDTEPASFSPPEQHHKLEFAIDDSKASELVMPTLYGRTVSEIVEFFSKQNIRFRLIGSGTVSKQWPQPGSLLKKDDLCIITLASNPDSPTFADLNASRK